MPPKKQPPPQDESRSEASSTKEKHTAGNGKNRRTVPAPSTGSSLKDVTSANTVTNNSNIPTGGLQDSNMQWQETNPSILHEYRYAYHLNTPAAFKHRYNHMVLSQQGIARMSPTMARRKEVRRQSKEQLTYAVRKHFNGLGIQENEVVVDFLYKVKWQDKNFRLKFAPPRPR